MIDFHGVNAGDKLPATGDGKKDKSSLLPVARNLLPLICRLYFIFHLYNFRI
jgi:hypothetical protein